ncbi:site-2 protease family protein [Thermococcus sp. Bubb.Bath]|uniref:site-2 protease family protein n=1 Tax=Thermococcus sp. Bubb.Bath TaxID=1638242 RepID=UPI001439C4F8|nr:site-2 protease family protein [Thermococcus sp. Bubb.Bath]NJF25931.1 site-2 protease family protein [Thermococcus sp. Bubb.Bath]
MRRGVYECLRCGHREVMDSTEPLLEGACPKCGGDMILIGYVDEEGPGAKKQPMKAPSNVPQVLPQEVESLLKKFYSLQPLGEEGGTFVFSVLEIHEKDFEKVLHELEEKGYWAALKRDGERVLLYIFPAAEVKPDNPKIGIALFLLTVLSTLWAGYVLARSYIASLDEFGLPGYRNPYVIALAFSLSILGILGTHEMGHKIAATLHGVKSTYPYFIPFPNILGTLGAVIRVKSPIPTRKAAIDLGVSGPIAGILVAIPVTVIGLRLSVVVPMSIVPHTGNEFYMGSNLLFMFLEKLALGSAASGDVMVFLHPVAMAGWVGILVTFLNLIPAAQLDGGHVARAFMNARNHEYLTLALGFGLMFLSYFWVGWLLWGILVLFIGKAGNPGALDEVSPIPTSRKLLALLALLLFVVSATPAPFYTG